MLRIDRHFSLVDVGNNYLILIAYFITLFIFSSLILDCDEYSHVYQEGCEKSSYCDYCWGLVLARIRDV